MSDPRPAARFTYRPFAIPRPFNWGYSFLFAAVGSALAMILSKFLFDCGCLSFSTTSVVGCGLITVLVTTLALMLPSVFIPEKTGLDITGRYTGVGTLVMSFLSGAPVFLIRASFRNIFTYLWLRLGNTVAGEMTEDQKSGLAVAIGQLKDKQKKVIYMKYVSHMKNDEIGAILNRAAGTVGTYHSKAMGKLRWPRMADWYLRGYSQCLPGLLVTGVWLCRVRKDSDNIWGPFLCLAGSRVFSLIMNGIIDEVDLTTLRTYSDMPTTFFFSSLPALVVSGILFAFFRKVLNEFHNTYYSDIYGETGSKYGLEDDTHKVNRFRSGFNTALFLGVIIFITFWIFMFKGIRL